VIRKWKSLKTIPKDGVWLDVMCRSKDGVLVEVKKVRYQNSRSMGLELRGEQNLLSPYLKPKKWDYAKSP
jgi:hypothetical protein